MADDGASTLVVLEWVLVTTRTAGLARGTSTEVGVVWGWVDWWRWVEGSCGSCGVGGFALGALGWVASLAAGLALRPLTGISGAWGWVGACWMGCGLTLGLWL